MKINLLDVLIVIVIIVAGIFVWRSFSGGTAGGESLGLTYTIELNNLEKNTADAIKKDDKVVISDKEKDTATVVAVSVEPEQDITFNKQRGEFTMVQNPVKYKATVVLQAKGHQTDSDFMIGSTNVKAGIEMPVKGKGYAGKGFVMSVNAE